MNEEFKERVDYDLEVSEACVCVRVRGDGGMEGEGMHAGVNQLGALAALFPISYLHTFISAYMQAALDGRAGAVGGVIWTLCSSIRWTLCPPIPLVVEATAGARV